MNEAYIIDVCRTPRGIGKVGKGALADIHPQQLAASTLKAIAQRNHLNTADVEYRIPRNKACWFQHTVVLDRFPIHRRFVMRDYIGWPQHRAATCVVEVVMRIDERMDFLSREIARQLVA